VTATELESRVAAIAAQATGARSGDPLAESGLDSVAMVRLLAAVEDGFGVQVPPSEITPENFSSVRALAALVARLVP
jgi:acyl carrier protein